MDSLVGLLIVGLIASVSGFGLGMVVGRNCLQLKLLDFMNHFNPHEQLYVDYIATIIRDMR